MPTSKWYQNLTLNWTVHIVDLIVVIIGVTIAFAVTNGAENRKGQKEKVVILNAMLSEIEKDMDVFESHQIPVNEKQVAHIARLIYIMDEPDASTDSIQYYFQHGIFPFSNWKITNITFESMKSSGKIDLIYSQELKNSIAQLYTSRLVQSNFIIELSMNINMDFIDYLTEKIDFANPDTYLEVIRERKFKNLLTRWKNINVAKVKEFKENKDALNATKVLIEKELSE
jgi:hypothetical protein